MNLKLYFFFKFINENSRLERITEVIKRGKQRKQGLLRLQRLDGDAEKMWQALIGAGLAKGWGSGRKG